MLWGRFLAPPYTFAIVVRTTPITTIAIYAIYAILKGRLIMFDYDDIHSFLLLILSILIAISFMSFGC